MSRKAKDAKEGPVGRHLAAKADRYAYEVRKGAVKGAAKGAAKAAARPVTNSGVGRAVGSAAKSLNRSSSNTKAVVAGSAGLYAGSKMSKEAGVASYAKTVKKAVSKASKNDNVRAFGGGIRQGAKDMSTGAKAVVVPGLVAGTVAGNMSKKDIEKKAASIGTKRLLVKARKGLRILDNESGKLVNKVAQDPMRSLSKAQGAAIGGSAAYVGQKSIQEKRRADKANK